MNIRLIDNTHDFAALHDEWNELLTASASASPFLRWEWLYPWWEHLGGWRRLAIAEIRKDGRIVAIAPFCASRGHLPFFRRWELLGTGFAGSDYLDGIVREGHEAVAARRLADCVRDRKVALHLDHLPVDAWLARLSAPLSDSGWTIRAVQHGVCPFIRLAGHTWDSFLATMGPSHRATTRRRLRLLDRTFAARFERVTDADVRKEALAHLFEFHEARFGRRGTAFQTSALRAFHLDATDRLSASQLLRLYTLRLNGQIAAVMYGLGFKGRFYFYQHGFDGRFQSHGIGRALLDLTIRAAIEEGFSEFDLLYGTESYKSAWTRASRHLVRMDVFPAHLGGFIHHRAVETNRSLRAAARRLISAHVPQAH